MTAEAWAAAKEQGRGFHQDHSLSLNSMSPNRTITQLYTRDLAADEETAFTGTSGASTVARFSHGENRPC